MAERKARVRITATVDSGLSRALNGVVDNARKASKQIAAISSAEAKTVQSDKRQTEKVTREAIENAKRAHIEKTKTVEELAKREIRAEQNAARESVREARRAASDKIREEERTAREQIKLARQASRERRQLIGGAIAGGAMGLAGAGANIIRRGQQAAGVQSLEERIGNASAFRLSLIDTANEARISEEDRMKYEKNFIKASKDFNIPLQDFADAMNRAQAGFDKARLFAEAMPELAKLAAGKNIPLADLVNTTGTASVGFELKTKEDLLQFVGKLIGTSERGSIEAGPTGAALGPLMADFALKTGRTGIVGASELLALSQVLGKYNPGQPEEIATQIQSLLTEIRGDKQTQAALRRAGVDVVDKQTGGLRGLADIGAQMAISEKFQKMVVTLGATGGGIFGRKEAQTAAIHLMDAIKQDPQAFLSLQNISAQEGITSAETGFARRSADSAWRLQNIGITAQADTADQMDRIIGKLEASIKNTTELQNQFPLMTEALKELTGVIKWGVGGLLAGKAAGVLGKIGLGGAEAVAGGAATGGILARLGLGGAAASMAGVGSMSLGAVAAGGALPIIGTAVGAGAAGFAAYEGVTAIADGLAGFFGGYDSYQDAMDNWMSNNSPSVTRGIKMPQSSSIDEKPQAPTKLDQESINALRETSRATVTIRLADGLRPGNTVTGEGVNLSIDSGY